MASFRVLLLLLLPLMAAIVPPILGLETGILSSSSKSTSCRNIYEGRWVFDDSYPLYNSSDCPFMEEAVFDCQKKGRPDQDYLKYRWQPTNCILPRNAFLVDIIPQKMGRLLMLDSISSGTMWLQNDILIFNSWHWWLHTGVKRPWDFIQDGNQTYKDMDRLAAFEKGLKTWGRWVDSKVNPKRIKVFFLGTPPTHVIGSEWGDLSSADCKGQTGPLQPPYPGGQYPTEAVVKRVLRRATGKKVHLLEITSLSQLRVDGHPSIYGFGGKHARDCSHWCLPGVPDTWNHLLYASLFTN